VYPETLSNLHRLRSRLLSTAYCHIDGWTRHSAYVTDQALATLAQHDAAGTETLATALLEAQHGGAVEDQALVTAAAAGIDTAAWAQRRDVTRGYATEAATLPPHVDAATEAERLWASLFAHYPNVAGALADYLTALPPTWREDLFPAGDLAPASATPGYVYGPETAPYSPTGWEDCEACAEAQDLCRYHRGFSAGQDHQDALIKTLLSDDVAMWQLQERHCALEAHRAAGKAAAPDSKENQN
jgi:hypothetical protein